MATKPGDDEKTPVWRQILAGVTTLVVVVGGLAAIWEDWKKGEAKDEDDDDEDEDDEGEAKDEDD